MFLYLAFALFKHVKLIDSFSFIPAYNHHEYHHQTLPMIVTITIISIITIMQHKEEVCNKWRRSRYSHSLRDAPIYQFCSFLCLYRNSASSVFPTSKQHQNIVQLCTSIYVGEQSWWRISRQTPQWQSIVWAGLFLTSYSTPIFMTSTIWSKKSAIPYFTSFISRLCCFTCGCFA